MADNIKIPEETLIRIGFKFLDLTYGELTIKKGNRRDEVFVDKHGEIRLGYDKPGSENQSLLVYIWKDKDDFLRTIPVELIDYQRVLSLWMEERYKRRVDTTGVFTNGIVLRMEERYKRRVDTTLLCFPAVE